jgi:alpha-L-fucosidase
MMRTSPTAIFRSLCFLLLNFLPLVPRALAADVTPPDQATQDKLWASRGCIDDARGKWFRDAKFGCFIHFGLFSELGGYYHGKGPYDPAEQIIGLGERHMGIPWQTYQSEVGGAFNPTNFDAHKWVSLIKRAGQKYVIVTTKHHDGFCMFRTATTKYNVVDSTPFARDVIKELADECRKQGIVFCPYYSIGDWTADKVMDPQFTNYHDYMFAQLKELMTQYGDIPLLWFDNWWYVNNQWSKDEAHSKELYAWLRALNPNVLVNDRCGVGAASTDGDYCTPENQLKGELQSRYFEVVMTDTDDDNWGWVRGATNYRTPAQIIHNLIDSTSKGGNFVLNVGPMANGDFPPEHVAIIDAVGAWLDVNGEAIYGTEPAPEVKVAAQDGFQCCATKKGSVIYLHILKWPENPATITIDHPDLKSTVPLGSADGLQFDTQKLAASTTLKITHPPTNPNPYATVLKLTFNQ